MSFKTSTGERLEKSTIDYRVKKAKDEFKAKTIDDGKAYCWACGHTGVNLSASHIISVDKCQKDGRTEIAWDMNNLQLECVNVCHIQTETRMIEHHANYRYKKEYIENYENG